VSSPKANKGDTRTESRAPKAQVQGEARLCTFGASERSKGQGFALAED